MIGAKLVEKLLPGVSNLEGFLSLNGPMILWHGQKELFPLSLVIGNSEVSKKMWSGAIAIDGLDAILEISCRHYRTLHPVRYIADDPVAKVGTLSDLLYV